MQMFEGGGGLYSTSAAPEVFSILLMPNYEFRLALGQLISSLLYEEYPSIVIWLWISIKLKELTFFFPYNIGWW